MSKQIKVDNEVYNQLDDLKLKHETFSQVIGELLGARLRIFELLNVLEGQLKYQEWKQQRIQEAVVACRPVNTH